MPLRLPQWFLACAAVLSYAPAHRVSAFLPSPPAKPTKLMPTSPLRFSSPKRAEQARALNARGRRDDDYDDDDEDDDDDRELVYAGGRSGRYADDGAEQYDDDRQSSSRGYQDNVEFFDLDDDDDDDMYEDDYGRIGENGEIYNGIIPNPLLDAMDPDGVYERLGPELFKDVTFWRDLALFAGFVALFTGDTHHYGTFDTVIEGLGDLPSNFVPGM